MAPLAVGQTAPDFSLPATTGGEVALADLRGDNKYLILAFYPKQRTSVCGAQLEMINEFLGNINAQDAAVAGISVDPLEDIANVLNSALPIVVGGTVTTTLDGSFQLAVAPRTYTCTASAGHYCSQSERITVTAGMTETLVFELDRCLEVFLPLTLRND